MSAPALLGRVLATWQPASGPQRLAHVAASHAAPGQLITTTPTRWLLGDPHGWTPVSAGTARAWLTAQGYDEDQA